MIFYLFIINILKMFYYLPHIIVSGIVILFFSIGSYSIYKEEKKYREENEKYLKNLTDDELKELYKQMQYNLHILKKNTEEINYEFYKQLENEYNKRIKK